MCDAWKRPGLKFNSCKQGLLLTEGVWGNDLLSWYILALLDLKIYIGLINFTSLKSHSESEGSAENVTNALR